MKLFDLFVAIFTVTTVQSFSLPANDLSNKGRIVNGSPSIFGQFPYAVMLIIDDRVCAGSFIDREWILTAAHCVIDGNYVLVYFGAWKTDMATISYTVYPQDIFIHPDYRSEVHHNDDIALIKIPTTNICTDIFPVPLPEVNSDPGVYVGKFAVASGWGLTSENLASYPFRLLYIHVPVLSNFDCFALMAIDTDKVLCTDSYKGSTPFMGDSGGPLVVEDNPVLIGVITGGSSMIDGSPTGYVRVSYYINWIKQITGI